MTRRSIHALGAAILLSGYLTAAVRAQDVHPIGPIDYTHNLQMFAPVDLGFDNQVRHYDGYFFTYDRLIWGYSGEHNLVGADLMRPAHSIWFDNIPRRDNSTTGLNNSLITPDPELFTVDAQGRPLNPDSPDAAPQSIQRPFFVNSFQETLPDGDLVWGGDRYQLGYMVDDRGWLVGILDGPKQQDFHTMGLMGGQILDSDFDDAAVPPDLPYLRSALGDVYIAFEYEPGLMHGFIDMIDATIGGFRVLTTDVNGDGILDTGDGFADDIDSDGQFGPDGYDMAGDDGVPDTFDDPNNDGTNGEPLSTLPDYDDLVELPTSFNSVVVRNTAENTGVELMRMHRIDNRHFQQKNQNNLLELHYGARYMRFRDDFEVTAAGGVLGDSRWDTEITNNLVGPQVAVRWLNKRGHWTTTLNTRFMFGYNVSNWDQNGAIGSNLIPGRLNRPLYLRPRSFSYGHIEQDFSPVGEIRLETSYQISQAVALKLGWTGMYVGNIRRASQHVHYRLPNMGFRDGGTQDVVINGLNLGVEFNH